MNRKNISPSHLISAALLVALCASTAACGAAPADDGADPGSATTSEPQRGAAAPDEMADAGASSSLVTGATAGEPSPFPPGPRPPVVIRPK